MSRIFTKNHLRILVLPTQLSKFLEPERESGQFFTSWDSAFFTELNNLSGVRKIFTGKISFSEFSLFMCVWASRWVFLDICRRMFGVYFTLCLPPGNARWKNEEKTSPEFCPFPIVGNDNLRRTPIFIQLTNRGKAYGDDDGRGWLHNK